MKITPLPEGYLTTLFNVSEIDAELNQVGCSIDMAEYIAWVIMDLGYPVFTPPWMSEPDLPFKARLVRDFHLFEVQELFKQTLHRNGYNGQELLVCTLGRTLCSISFLKEQAK